MSSTTPAAQLRSSVPEGTIPVGISLLIAGLATYAFFKVGTVAVGGVDEFAPLASMWFAVFALAPGFFLPLEQELGRALSGRRAVGEGGRPSSAGSSAWSVARASPSRSASSRSAR